MTTTIKQRLTAIALLVLLTTVLPEIFSANTPAEYLFHPANFIFFLLGYGLPVLVIREWSIRTALNGTGIFLAGMAYGLINEALIAKTVFLETGVPADVFDNYGFAFGINFPWSLCIMVWHGLSSVLFPITLAHFFVPGAAHLPWLGKKTTIALALAAVVLSSAAYLTSDVAQISGTVPMLAIIWLAIAVLALTAMQFKGIIATAASTSRLKPFMFGLAGLPFFLAILLVAGTKVPIPIYFAAFAILAWLWVFLLIRNGWQHLPAFGRVAYGWYMQTAVFGWQFMYQRSWFTIAFGGILLVALHWLCLRAERNVSR